jgi:hypothetical protein
MRHIVILAIIFIFSIKANSQYYHTAVGLKLAWGVGVVNAKHFLGYNSNSAVEVSLDIQNEGFVFNGFYEYHLEAFKTNGLFWYFGGGPFLGVWGENNPWKTLIDEKTAFVSGVTAIMGIEYTLENYPFNFAIDLEPKYNFAGPKLFWAYGGITVRYTFKEKDEEESKTL